MKKLFITNTGKIVVDENNNVCQDFESDRAAINSVYAIKEPMHVICGGRYEESGEFDVDKNDIIITFYDNSFEKKLIVVKSEEWNTLIQNYNKRMQEEREKWANEKKALCDDGENTACSGTCESNPIF